MTGCCIEGGGIHVELGGAQKLMSACRSWSAVALSDVVMVSVVATKWLVWFEVSSCGRCGRLCVVVVVVDSWERGRYCGMAVMVVGLGVVRKSLFVGRGTSCHGRSVTCCL